MDSQTAAKSKENILTDQEWDLLMKITESSILMPEEAKVLKVYVQKMMGRKTSTPKGIAKSLQEYKSYNVHVILPAYNEENSLPNLLNRLSSVEQRDRLIVWLVDDGSTDRTALIAKNGVDSLDIRLLSHKVNLGLGQALQTGISNVLKAASVEDAVIVMDADDTHDTEIMGSMLEKIDEGADIVLASRFVKGGSDSTAPPLRRVLSRGAALVFNIILPLNGIKDFTSGFRAYKACLLKKSVDHWGNRLIEERGFACMVELLLKLRHWEPKIAEVPLVLRYDRKKSQSKLKLWRTLWQYLKLAIRDLLQPPPIEKF
jgi:dolichol-phosphate mannosyltransferase